MTDRKRCSVTFNIAYRQTAFCFGPSPTCVVLWLLWAFYANESDIGPVPRSLDKTRHITGESLGRSISSVWEKIWPSAKHGSIFCASFALYSAHRRSRYWIKMTEKTRVLRHVHNAHVNSFDLILIKRSLSKGSCACIYVRSSEYAQKCAPKRSPVPRVLGRVR
jgi:hypothetical protein